LPAESNFRYFVRSNCDFADQSSWQGPKFGYLAKSLPYANTFEDAGKNFTDGFVGFTRLTTSATSNPANYADGGAGNAMYTANSTTAVSNRWAYTRGINLAAGQQVITTYKTRLFPATAVPMLMDFTVGNAQIPAAQTTVIQSNTESSAAAYTTRTATWTAPTAGIYFFGFHNIAAAGAVQSFLFIDTIGMSSPLAVNNFLNNSFSISPNPANDFVTISSKNSAINKIDLTDINGRIVKTAIVGDLIETTVNISDLASGVYMIKIASAEGVATKKIIKN
jgi:Secretion system C-terminal sorting domain